MAVTMCPECGRAISADAKVCPHCGKQKGGMSKALKWGLIGLGCLLVIGAVARSGKEAGSTNSREAPEATASAPAPSVPSHVRATAGPAPVAQVTRDPLSFGRPTVKTSSGMTRVMVEATNTTSNEVSCLVTATFMRGDTILGTASGAVNQLAPRAVRTAELISMDSVSGHDRLKLEASTCF